MIKRTPLKYLEEFNLDIENNRIEAIYNYEYQYFKSMIPDTEAQLKYGNERSGYEKYKQEHIGMDIGHSREQSLRIVSKDGVIEGYIVETKRTVNTKLGILSDAYNNARAKFAEILGCTDTKMLFYWLDENISISYNEANSYMYAVRKLDSLLNDYYNDEDFKEFIDRLI